MMLLQTSTAAVATVLIVVHCGLLGVGAVVHSPTLNEPAHLVAGISNWTLGCFDIYRVNPPLVRMIACAPVLVADYQIDWQGFQGTDARYEFQLGEQFVAANGERSYWLFAMARWACIPFSLVGGFVCYRWARDLYGADAGVFALALWCFCPNILAHVQLITPEIAATSLSLAACYTFWRWLREPTWSMTLVSGLVLGLAELAKMTLIVFFAMWPVMWLVYRWADRKTLAGRDWLRELGMLAARMLVAIYVLNFGYGFEGSLTPLGKFQFVSDTLRGNADAAKVVGNRFADSWLGCIPAPVPKNYLLGMDLQKVDFEHSRELSYLRGQFSPRGWWYYYLYALAIKVPLGTWLLAVLAALARFWIVPRATLRDEFILLCPAVVILAFVSSQTGFSEHMRYVLPTFPFAFVWIGRLAPAFRGRHIVLAGTIACALVWSVGSSLRVYPQSL
ncbi:MAG: glycosyltransferase family 39 protein [Planctomycetia bacterium]|nr:glycosyltransferase family 39 protein [Planctomycetia bacterium]